MAVKKEEPKEEKLWFSYTEAKSKEAKGESITQIKLIDGVKMYGFMEEVTPVNPKIAQEEQERLSKNESYS